MEGQDTSLGPVTASPMYVVEDALDLAGVTSKDTVVDLGCNDGRVLIQAAQRYGARCTGYEIYPDRVHVAKQKVKEAGVEALVTIQQGNLMEANLKEASVVYCFLLPRGLPALCRKLLLEMRPGARVVTYMFRMPELQPHLRQTRASSSGKPGRPDTSHLSKLYLYEIPPREPSKWLLHTGIVVGHLAVFAGLALFGKTVGSRR